jgi:5'-3' exonuclease
MGIPSYYKRLSNSIKGLVVPHRLDKTLQVDTLLFDFNCMIYQILRSPDLAPFPGYGHSDAIAWENNVCQLICDYTAKVWCEVGKPKTVLLAIDGVVPMAKIRQQRLRRFKSIWTAKEEVARGIRPNDPNRWDTNAITPGTAFMERLSQRLSKQCKTMGWTLSDASEPGEGEQKCMAFWRKHAATVGNVVIYGLDADLILLCLLTKQLLKTQGSVWCIRESAEWEGTGAGFMRLSIDKLFDALRNSSMDPLDWTLDYVAAMSFLGDDFVPHGLSLKIRDGGHDRLLQNLKDLHSAGNRLTTTVNNRVVYTIEGVRCLATLWASQEEQKLLESMKNKHHKINYEDWQMLPCVWAEEQRVLCQAPKVLHRDWDVRMMNEWFGKGVSTQQVCSAYAYGLQWILDYYTGQVPVNTTWIYPWSLPPSWKQWSAYCTQQTSLEMPETVDVPANILPQEQLAMVLPLESWHFLRDPVLQTLPSRFPQFWPVRFGFFSAGKTFLWECEAELPLLHLATVRSTS